MKIRTEEDITGPIAKSMRVKLGLTQPEFWGAVRVKQPVASRYEAGLRLPDPVRLLLFVRYVAGIELKCNSKAGANRLCRLATGEL